MSKCLVEKGLFVYTSDHFESLKELRKCIEYAYIFLDENFMHNYFTMVFEKEDLCCFFLFIIRKMGFLKLDFALVVSI